MVTKILDGLDVASQKITNVATGTNPGDAINLAQLQLALAGLDPKQSVRTATTTNITLSGLTAVNGYTPVAGDRILVKNQTDATQNGIYAAASGAWARTADASAGTLSPGAVVTAEVGTTDADTVWLLTTDDPFTVGTSTQTWSKWGGGGGAYTAGNGVSISGSVINVVPGSGLVADGTSVRIDPNSTAVGRHRSYAVPAGTNPVVTHDLNTTAIGAQLWDISGAAPVQVLAAMQATSTTTVTVPTTATTGQYRLDLVG